MFAYIEPGYRIPSRTQVTSMVKKRHTSGKKKLCDVLQKEARFVAVTTDAWTSKAVNHLLCILHILLMEIGAYRVTYQQPESLMEGIQLRMLKSIYVQW